MKTKKSIILLIVFLLTGCMVSDFRYDFNELQEQVISTEIVNVQWLDNGQRQIDILNQISDEQLSNLLSDLSEINFEVVLGRPQKSNGKCFKLNYKDEFELVCSGVLNKYSNDYVFISGKDIYKPKDFDDLILKYQELK